MKYSLQEIYSNLSIHTQLLELIYIQIVSNGILNGRNFYYFKS